VASRAVTISEPLESEELAFLLRVEGAPYMWPQAWTLSGVRDEGSALAALDTLSKPRITSRRRCGVARAKAEDGTETFAAVFIDDVVADLAPIPTRVHAGRWVRVDATIRIPSFFAKVLVLGPKGAPRLLPTTLHGDHVVSTVALDQPGRWVIQVMATLEGGPLPVAEAVVFADEDPPRAFDSAPAPGEWEGEGADGASALERMLDSARASEGLAPLARSGALDAVARAHATRMKEQGRLAHDVGDGDPVTRLRAAGIDVQSPGENVAHATDVRHAHRALWASPSHRSNLLDPRFTAVGIGTEQDADGRVWVCELFADFADAGIVRD
jgi:uncharacterized protein YkwD